MKRKIIAIPEELKNQKNLFIKFLIYHIFLNIKVGIGALAKDFKVVCQKMEKNTIATFANLYLIIV